MIAKLSGSLRRIIGSLVGGSSPGPAADSEVPASSGDGADALMRDGVARHMKGDLGGAEAAYRKVLEGHRDHVDAMHLLGKLLGQKGQLDQARDLLERVLAVTPGNGEANSDLGNVYRAKGDAKRAEECFRRVLDISPENAAAHRNLGYLRLEEGNEAEALQHLTAALKVEPEVLQDQFTVAEALANGGAHAEAIPHYQKSVAIKPDLALAHNHLAFSLSVCGRHDEAMRHYGEAIALDPNDYVSRNDYGLLLQKFARYEAAAEQLKKAIELNPEFAGGHLNLGNVNRDLGRFADARRCYQKAMELEPENADAHNNLGTVLKDQGRVAESTEHVRRAIELRPGFAEAHSNLLMNLQYMDDVGIDALYQAHQEWVSSQIQTDIRPLSDHRNAPDPERPLRIGYISPDFCTHPVGLFLQPVLECHDESKFFVICYDDLYRGDAVTERLKPLADEWRSVAGRDDQQVGEMIRSDAIDILVDLTGHTANNRMRLFARRPAPVQASWIGYLHSTGLPQMDYLIADAVAVPEDTRQQFSETVVRLPHCFLCYGQPEGRPDASPPPSAECGFVTFGSYNNLAKLSDTTLRRWKRILDETADSRLLLKNSAFNDAETREEYLQKLGALEFDPGRVTLEGSSAHGEYFSSYSRIDIALDPHPFSGGTISVDALWMGVPVVTLAGDRMASRTSASVLSCLGLDALVTDDDDAYVGAAVSLAADAGSLAGLRRDLRARFRQTALGEAKMFTANLEKAYRDMWREWCRRQSRD